jgi:hypothetical protein
MVEKSDEEGTTFAALNATAAAIVVWASDRELSAREVRNVLLSTARHSKQVGSVKILDTERALALTRRQLLLDALQDEPMELGQILAETGLSPEVAVPIIEKLVASRTLVRSRSGDVEKVEDPNSMAQQYARLRTLASGAERNRQLKKLVAREGDMARHGRYTKEKSKLFGKAAMTDGGSLRSARSRHAPISVACGWWSRLSAIRGPCLKGLRP